MNNIIVQKKLTKDNPRIIGGVELALGLIVFEFSIGFTISDSFLLLEKHFSPEFS